MLVSSNVESGVSSFEAGSTNTNADAGSTNSRGSFQSSQLSNSESNNADVRSTECESAETSEGYQIGLAKKLFEILIFKYKST